jgi:hypothetical protein
MIGWVVRRDPRAYPDAFVARLISAIPTPYGLLADRLDGLQAPRPVGFVRTECQPVNPPEVVEIGIATERTSDDAAGPPVVAA